jgi:SMODS-associating 2TM, beta-strand rich effector domain
MHSYSTDSTEREKVLLVLAGLAIAAAWGLFRIFRALRTGMPWWIDAPSTMGLYGVFFSLFDSIVWRRPILHQLSLVKVPVLAGEWQGYVVSSFDNHKKTHEVEVRIKQSWTRIMILLSSKNSYSHTVTAAIEVNAPDGVVLSYQYENEPKADAVKTMEMHVGTARITLVDKDLLEGYYYSGRGRGEHGLITLKRVPA